MNAAWPLRAAAIVTACAALYAAWLDTPDGATPAQHRRPPAASRATADTTSVHAATATTKAVDLFATPAWRRGAMASPMASLPPPDTPLNDAVSVRRSEPIEVSVIWRDADGVKVVLTHEGETRIACHDCSTPGRLLPGEVWHGHRLDAVSRRGVTLIHVATGKRVELAGAA